MSNLFDLYQEYVVDLAPVLWDMGMVNGIHIDNESRLALVSEMNGIIREKVEAAQPFVPEDLYPLKHFKRVPKTKREVRIVEVPNEKVKTCSNCGLQHVTKGEHTGTKGGKKGVPLNACYKSPIVTAPGIDIEYDVVLPFNPGSDDQLKAYALKYKHKLSQNWKTKKKTLDAKTLQKFIDKYGHAHPIYAHARDIRKVRKARGYARGWVPNSAGLAFGQYKNVPETFRLSQAKHNFTNVSHRGDAPYAKELRRLLVAPPGYRLVEADSSSVEAVFSGLLMGSSDYMAKATKGIHAAWALARLGLPDTIENIKRAKSPGDNADWWQTQGHNPEAIDILYATKKRTVHGVTYGMGAILLHYSYPEYFPTVASAQAEIDDFYSFVPELQAWHKDTRDRAFKQGFLTNRWGLKNYYYQVYTWDHAKKQYKMGADAKAVIAFDPQSSNGMFQRKNLVLINRAIKKMGKQDRWFQTAIGHVHDSNGLRVPEDDTDRAAEMLAEIMNRKIPQMNNIRVGVQVKAGFNWQDMKTVLTV